MPRCPEKVRAPALRVRLQALWAMFFLLCARHFPATLRPLSVRVKVKLTLAVSFRLKEKGVPSGCALLILAALPASRQLEWLCFRAVMRGAEMTTATTVGAMVVAATLTSTVLEVRVVLCPPSPLPWMLAWSS